MQQAVIQPSPHPRELKADEALPELVLVHPVPHANASSAAYKGQQTACLGKGDGDVEGLSGATEMNETTQAMAGL